ncbi:hypothetical protein GYMLUDRAFT_704046 [Collybiopsis luxurians FD-317 M1]|uniref:Uncharacterized protein n=1 Tax=Collybiopsis luxurians FD-317 M1 TaxID=944289 RepID=A0A0D0CR62_9AGAR|nr:hypothetical protein GYMLUDRAFT_704046 [Collybiopsis luxurians FD-317 M1]
MWMGTLRLIMGSSSRCFLLLWPRRDSFGSPSHSHFQLPAFVQAPSTLSVPSSSIGRPSPLSSRPPSALGVPDAPTWNLSVPSTTSQLSSHSAGVSSILPASTTPSTERRGIPMPHSSLPMPSTTRVSPPTPAPASASNRHVAPSQHQQWSSPVQSPVPVSRQLLERPVAQTSQPSTTQQPQRPKPQRRNAQTRTPSISSASARPLEQPNGDVSSTNIARRGRIDMPSSASSLFAQIRSSDTTSPSTMMNTPQRPQDHAAGPSYRSSLSNLQTFSALNQQHLMTVTAQSSTVGTGEVDPRRATDSSVKKKKRKASAMDEVARGASTVPKYDSHAGNRSIPIFVPSRSNSPAPLPIEHQSPSFAPSAGSLSIPSSASAPAAAPTLSLSQDDYEEFISKILPQFPTPTRPELDSILKTQTINPRLLQPLPLNQLRLSTIHPEQLYIRKKARLMNSELETAQKVPTVSELIKSVPECDELSDEEEQEARIERERSRLEERVHFYQFNSNADDELDPDKITLAELSTFPPYAYSVMPKNELDGVGSALQSVPLVNPDGCLLDECILCMIASG